MFRRCRSVVAAAAAAAAATAAQPSSPHGQAAKEAIPVVMAHGMASGLGCYYRIFDSLVDIDGGRRILAFDWLGMVRAPTARPSNWRASARLFSSALHLRPPNSSSPALPPLTLPPPSLPPSPPTPTRLQGRSSRPKFPKRNALFPQDVAAMEADSIEWFLSSMEAWREGESSRAHAKVAIWLETADPSHRPTRTNRPLFLTSYDVTTPLAAMKLEKFDLVAHSMGGYFAVLYAIRHPERVNKLVLISPCGLPAMPKAEVKVRWVLRRHSEHTNDELQRRPPPHDLQSSTPLPPPTPISHHHTYINCVYLRLALHLLRRSSTPGFIRSSWRSGRST